MFPRFLKYSPKGDCGWQADWLLNTARVQKYWGILTRILVSQFAAGGL
jgi:hypothetical protein